MAYARRLPVQGLDIGINTKIVHRKIGDFASSWGFGIDAALQFETESEWKFGLMVRDITTTFNAWSIDEEEFNKIQNAIPGENQEAPESLELTKPKMQFGVSKTFVAFRDFNILTEIDLNMRFSETNDILSSSFLSIDPGVGLQFDYLSMVYLRLGVNNFQYFTEFDGAKSTSLEPNFGVGFRYKGIQIDYALANIGAASGTLYSNIFSVKVDIGYFR